MASSRIHQSWNMCSQPQILIETAKQTREKREGKGEKKERSEKERKQKKIMHHITFIHNIRNWFRPAPKISKVLHRNFIAVLCHIYN